MLTVDMKTRHLPFLQPIADADVTQLLVKDAEYGASWKSRGGVGAFMMLARKWDRLENMVKSSRTYAVDRASITAVGANGHNSVQASAYDIFAHVVGAQRERGDAESLLDTLGDLRRYLLLVEGEVMAMMGKAAPVKADAPSAPATQDPGLIRAFQTAVDPSERTDRPLVRISPLNDGDLFEPGL